MARASAKKRSSNKLPSKFITVTRGYVDGKHANEENALIMAERLCQPGRYGNGADEVGVYRLVKVVRRKQTPVEIVEVACCE